MRLLLLLALWGQGDWIGQRVFTKHGTVLKVGRVVVDDEKREGSPSGGARNTQRIYRVQKVNGPWLWLVAEQGGASGWVKAEQVVPYDQAIDYYTSAIRAHPTSAAYVTRGSTWNHKHEYDIAIGDFNEAIRLDPRNEIAFLDRGLAWYNKNELDQAIADYTEAIRLDPRYAAAYYNRGLAWYDKKEWDKAVADYSAAIRLDPEFALAYFGRGVAWHAKKDLDKAIADLGKAIRLDPKNALAYYIRGNARYDKKDFDQAIADYSEVIRLDPQNVTAHFSRSFASLVASRDGASSDARIYLSLQGWREEHSLYVVLIGHFGHRQRHRDAEAKQILDEAASKGDTSAWPYPIIRYLRREIDEKALLAAATDNVKMTEARAYLGLALALSGHSEEALSHLRWVKDHGKQTYIEYGLALAEIDRIKNRH